MKLALVAVGQAGGKVTERMLAHDDRTPGTAFTSVTAINTAASDLAGLDLVPGDRRVLVGESRVKGHGVGADNELAATIAEQESAEILGSIDHVPVGRTDAFLVVAALGGGTGSGAGPVVARHLSSVYSAPVYGLGILPAGDEGGIYTLNAARSFRTFAREVDSLMLFDNDAWRKPGRTLSGSYRVLNEEIARRFGLLFSAGDVEAGGAVAESVVDASEILNTLDCGGVSTVGYATAALGGGDGGLLGGDDGGLLGGDDGGLLGGDDGGFLGRLLGSTPPVEEAEATSLVVGSVRQATRGRLTVPAEVGSARRGLVVVAGPPGALSRKGVERGRDWLEEAAGTMEVRGGDYPTPGADRVAAAVLLSGVTRAPRIDELQQVAIETRDAMADLDETHEAETRALLDADDELDPLF